MTAIKKQLVVVGGIQFSTGKKTGQVVALSMKDDQSTLAFPQLKLPRSSPGVITFGDWLIVIAGQGLQQMGLDSVVRLKCSAQNDVSEQSWSSCPPLPMKCMELSAAIFDNMLYVFAGRVDDRGSARPSNSIFRIPINALVSGDMSQCWETLSIRAPLFSSTVVSMQVQRRQALLAICGKDETMNETSHVYVLHSEHWEQLCTIKTPRCSCACINLPKINELLIIGGKFESKFLTDVRKLVL